MHSFVGGAWEIILFHRIHDHPINFWGYLIAIFSHQLTQPIDHFAFNTVGVLALGVSLEAKVGTRWFVWLFVISGVVAGIGGAMFEDTKTSLGASGGDMGFLGAALIVGARLHPGKAGAILAFAALLWIALALWAAGVAFPP